MILNRLAEHPNLPSPPAVALKVLERASRPDCTMAEVAQVIQHDPALCGNLIKLVNSALYTIPRAVTSVDRALHLLGLKRVLALVLSLALPAMQRRRRSDAAMQNFWKASVAGAVVARELAQRLRRPDPETDMVTALLRDVGVLVLLETFPEKVPLLAQHAPADLALKPCDVEKEVWGVSHTEVGAFLLKRWRLPPEFTEPVRYHHQPGQAPPAVREQALLLYFAHLLGQLQVTPGQSALVEAVVDLGRARFGLGEQQLQGFVEPLQAKIAQVAGLLRVEVGECVDYKQLLVRTADTLTRMVVETTVENLVMQEEKKQAEEALRASEAQARQAQKMEAVGRLAGGIAHDFNNLLTVINGYSSLLATMLPADSPGHGFVEQIRAAGDRAATLTGQLLAFSRKQLLRPVDLDLNAAVIQLDRIVGRLLGERITVVHTLAPDLTTVHADPGQIDQVLLNLLVNARDAMPDGGTVTIETANVDVPAGVSTLSGEVRPGPYVLLALTDTGCGMDEPTRRHAFEPFFTTKEMGKGTGLGLATVHGIVKQTGGYLVLDSEPGKGSCFRIYLPRGGAPPAAPPGTAAPVALSGYETILVAEDDDAVRSLIGQTLQVLGYTVLEAANGEAALTAARGHAGPLDLLLTDVVMPRLDGCELSRRLQQDRPGLRVCYITGYVDDEVLRAGALDASAPFLHKPFSPQALAVRVREALGPRSAGVEPCLVR
jgi:signal transduction histidine kinase